MGSLLSIIPIVVRRAAANARLLLAVVIGAVLAAGLMSTMSTYADAIRELGLEYAIGQEDRDDTNVRVFLSSQSSIEESYRRTADSIDTAMRRALGPVLLGPATAVARSATFYPTPPGGSVSEDENRPRSHLQFLTNLEPHIRVVDGRLPRAAPALEAVVPAIEVAIGAETSQRLGVNLGDRFDLHPFWKPEAAPVRATVVGIIEPVDLKEPYWRGRDEFFTYQSRWPTLPFFVAEASYFGAVATYLPTMNSDFSQLFYIDTSRINADSAESVRRALLGIESQLKNNIPRTSFETVLPDVIATYDEKLFFTRIPLLVLVLQIAGIVLYYLFMVSTMLVERQAGEVALLKSRGATTAQVMQIYIVEGLLISAIALVLGPPLAAAVISVLGQTPSFSDLTGGSSLSVQLTPEAYLWAAGGALLAYATLLWPAFNATRRTVVQQRTAASRPPKEAAFTRYYLDLVLVGIVAILFYELNRRGSLVTESVFGEQSVDPILLLTPAFFILTVGIVFLRLFPLVLRLLSWAGARVQGVAVLIGMWQLVRNPVHYSRLVLLLMLATAVGTFASSFGATLDRSYADRAAYESGARLRLADLRRFDAVSPAAIERTLSEEMGAEAVSPVFRTSISQGQRVQRVSAELLGIDPATFGAVASFSFRDDFAGPSLPSLLQKLEADAPAESSLVLPANSRYLGIWLNPSDVIGGFALEAEARDGGGRYLKFVFGPATGYELQPGWTFLVADLTRPRAALSNVELLAAPPQTPLTLTNLSLRFDVRAAAWSGAVQVDDLQAGPTLPPALATSGIAFDPQRQLPGLPDGEVIADFDSTGGWAPIRGLLPQASNDEVRTVPSGTAGSALELRWRLPAGGRPRSHGLRQSGNETPLTVLASEGFIQRTRLEVGDITRIFAAGSYLDVEIAGTFDLFPTLADAREAPALLANGSRLSSLLNLHPRAPVIYPAEYWLEPGPETLTRLRQAVSDGRLHVVLSSFDEISEAQERDPLVAAGWEGILFISFAAILLLSAIGFLIYSYLTAQRRTLEFAVLRTMGFSRRQIAAVVGFEQAFVIGLGMVAGTLLGLRLGGLMIRYMDVTETGDEVLPPMLLEVSWLTVGSAWLALSLVFLVTIGVVVLMYSRLQLHRVLRIGEV